MSLGCAVYGPYTRPGWGVLIQIQVKYPSSIVHLEWRLSCCHGNAKLESLETECSTSLLEGLVTFYGTQTFMLFVLGQNEDVRIVKRHVWLIWLSCLCVLVSFFSFQPQQYCPHFTFLSLLDNCSFPQLYTVCQPIAEIPLAIEECRLWNYSMAHKKLLNRFKKIYHGVNKGSVAL